VTYDGSVRTIALAVTGSIAAYKAVEVARLLVKSGARVLPLMTSSATRFIGPVTLSGICGAPVAIDMWDAAFAGELHVSMADRADVVAIVPATADVLARLATGRADDLVTATALCARGPVVVAPAMHPRMWNHPATRANVAALESRVRFVGPVDGPVASGDSGMGRLAEPTDIVRAIEGAFATRDLAGKRIVVTAGPTYEPLDPVRFLGNRSSGRMGFAVAGRAAARGAEVVLVAGPVALSTPAGVERRDVETAEEMRNALADAMPGAHALVMAAAVADFRPAQRSSTKIKKGTRPAIDLAENPDLVAEIAARPHTATIIAFALETGDDDAILAYAKKKLAAKKVDLIVANAASESLGRDSNRVAFVDATGATPFIEDSKEALADRILDRLVS
jgi:phosphopantothenoylcysteine decarboxylase / phosphopantothenate---cysteine ligase